MGKTQTKNHKHTHNKCSKNTTNYNYKTQQKAAPETTQRSISCRTYPQKMHKINTKKRKLLKHQRLLANLDFRLAGASPTDPRPPHNSPSSVSLWGQMRASHRNRSLKFRNLLCDRSVHTHARECRRTHLTPEKLPQQTLGIFSEGVAKYKISEAETPATKLP